MSRSIKYHGLEIPEDKLADFCRRWKIAEFALFGSILRDDFRHDSDVDVLVTFTPDAQWSLLDHVQIQEELASLLGRKVEVVTREAVDRSSNWIRRREILRTAQIVYAAG